MKKPFVTHLAILSMVLSTATLSSFSGCSPQQSPKTLTVLKQAAEFEQQKAIWLIWPTYEHKNGVSNSDVTLTIIRELIEHVKIHVSCNSSQGFVQATDRLQQEFGAHPNLNILELPSSEIWIRDMGPNFVLTKEAGTAIVDFNFNTWGYSDTTDADNQRDEAFDVQLATTFGLPVIESSLISEGGNRELNGKGTLMITESVELGRNPGWTKQEIEAEYKRTLGVTHIIWLKEGLREDDHTFRGPFKGRNGNVYYTVATTNGHIDEFARFVNPTTILLAEVSKEDLYDPFAQENHRRLEENYEILKQSTDQDGNPFTIIRIPLPETLTDILNPGDYVYDFIQELNYESGVVFPKGEQVSVVAATSYLNFLITDKVILGQKYGGLGRSQILSERDKKAQQILESVFPDRKVILLDAYAINLGGGGIHCITMNEPKY